MNDEARTSETSLAIPDDMALAKVPRSDVVALLLETAGTIKLTDEQREIVFAKVKADLVEIREDGIVYLPAVEYKQTLCEAFGLEWAVVPESPKPVEVDGVILWGFHLFIQGQPVAFAWGEQRYKMGDWGMSYGDAMEGAKSNAIMRLCKQIGIAQDLWRPSFIRKWKAENSEEYEGVDRKTGKKKMMWKRLEITGNAEEPEADGSQEEKQTTGDMDRFRRTSFLMVEYLKIDEARMKAECKEMFGVDSRANMPPEQWAEYRGYLENQMDETKAIDYSRWLEVRSATKSLTDRGMDKKELKFYLQTHYLRLDVVDSDLPEDLPLRLKRSGTSDKYYASLQKGVQRTKEWAEAIGGQGKAEELLSHLQTVLDDTTNTGSLAEFFKNLGIAPDEDGNYRLTDISPVIFGGWKGALGVKDDQQESQDAADDTAQGDPPPETTEGQEPTITPAIKSAAHKALSLLVKTFPGSKYMTVASVSFRERAAKDIGREIALMSDLTHADVLKITESLEAEKVKVLQDSADRGKLAEAEKFKADLTAGEDEDGEPVADDVLTAEESEVWFNSPEFAEQLNAYMIRSAGHFADAIKATAFHRANGLAAPRYWSHDDFDKGNSLLDKLDAEDKEPTTPKEPAQSSGTCTDEDYKELGKLFKKLLPAKEYAIGSQEAHDLVRESKAIKFPGVFTSIKKMTTEQTSDLTLFLQDRTADMKADAAERATEAAKHNAQ